MNNASFYYILRIKQMCYNASVKLVYLLPYSPDLNLIKEFFVELKALIKLNWHFFEEDPKQGFNNFLE